MYSQIWKPNIYRDSHYSLRGDGLPAELLAFLRICAMNDEEVQQALALSENKKEDENVSIYFVTYPPSSPYMCEENIVLNWMHHLSDDGDGGEFVLFWPLICRAQGASGERFDPLAKLNDANEQAAIQLALKKCKEELAKYPTTIYVRLVSIPFTSSQMVDGVCWMYLPFILSNQNGGTPLE